MHPKLQQYSKSDLAILILIVVPWLVILNRLIVGTLYFLDFTIFLPTIILTFISMFLSWKVHAWISVVLRERFPHESQATPRLLFAIPLFILITSLNLTLLFWAYHALFIKIGNFRNDNYNIALVAGAVMNIFVTFVYEGIPRFEKWKAVLIENEQLKKEYMQSQLLGLKSQINPHFLFNSLNSLSSLINDDEQEAELFLDEMSKVYRYLLRNNDEELVPLQTELDFIRSFYYLMKTRHGRALELHIDVSEAEAEKCLPPLTLQMLLDDVFNSNAGTRDQPIVIRITANEAGLEVCNNIHRRLTEDLGPSGNLENVINKFWLLCQKRVEVDETETSRVIRIPLITEKKCKAA